MQQLDVSLSIPVPDDFILIKKVELAELKEQTLSGVYWDMKDLEKRLGKGHDWIKEKILYPERFKKILDIENGGFVYYPKVRGQTWNFQAVEMAKFLDKNFKNIFS